MMIEPTHCRKDPIILAAAARFEAKLTMDVLSSQGVEFTFLEVGVGAVNSAIRAAQYRSLVTSRTVFFIGSCGQSHSFLGPALICANSVAWEPATIRQSRGYLVPGAEPEISLDSAPYEMGLPSHRVCSSGEITSIEESIPNVFENLELYSVVSAWRPVVDKLYCILGVTNKLGPNAHSQWKENFQTVAELTANAFSTLNFTVTANHST